MGGIWSGRWGNHIPKQCLEDCWIRVEITRCSEVFRRSGLAWVHTLSKTRYWFDDPEPGPDPSLMVRDLHVAHPNGEEFHATAREATLGNGVTRWYLVCPYCQELRMALYVPLPGWNLWCRECHDLGYRSRREPKWLRGLTA